MNIRGLLFGAPSPQGPSTQQERAIHAVVFAAFGIIAGVLLWCIFVEAPSKTGWFGFFITAPTILFALIGYIAPRWFADLLLGILQFL